MLLSLFGEDKEWERNSFCIDPMSQMGFYAAAAAAALQLACAAASQCAPFSLALTDTRARPSRARMRCAHACV